MVNIMNHKWVNDMDEEDKASVLISESNDPELSEEVLTMMLARGIDREKTIQVCFIHSYSFIHPSWEDYELTI